MYTDPFTTSTGAQPTDDISSVDDCLERLRLDQFPTKNTTTMKAWIDEILVVVNDDVIHHYSFEDGLGDDLPAPSTPPTPPPFPDFQEEEDEGDSEEA